MKKFVIKVNGNVYEVEVEETEKFENTPVKAQVSETKAAPKAAAPAGGNVVSAPMPGTIVDVKVSAGTSVKAGDVLCILEAMKMENEIVAPADGTVAAVNTSKGASVNTGDALVTLG